jgi:hypothetical protein
MPCFPRDDFYLALRLAFYSLRAQPSLILLTTPSCRAKLKDVRKFAWISALFLPLFALLGAGPVFSAPPSQATIAQSIFIQSPREGQALQGIEIIEGKIRGDGFSRGKISFSYAGVENPTWFFIADIESEGADSSQASFKVEWDTSQITDGNYHLRVVAEYSSGPAIFELIPDLRIRNHSPVETSTPALVQEDGRIEITPSASPEPVLETLVPTLPLNPVVIKSEGLSRVLLGSGVFVVLAFAAGGLYWLIKYRADN